MVCRKSLEVWKQAANWTFSGGSKTKNEETSNVALPTTGSKKNCSESNKYRNTQKRVGGA